MSESNRNSVLVLMREGEVRWFIRSICRDGSIFVTNYPDKARRFTAEAAVQAAAKITPPPATECVVARAKAAE
jgi:hypothetical protein